MRGGRAAGGGGGGVFVWRCMATMYENFAVNISRSVQTVSLYRLNGRITLDNN